MKSPFNNIESRRGSTNTAEVSQRLIEREPVPLHERTPQSLAREQVGGRFEIVHASAGTRDWLTDGDSFNGDNAVVKRGGLKWLAYTIGGILLIASFYALTTLIAIKTFGMGALLVWGAGFLP